MRTLPSQVVLLFAVVSVACTPAGLKYRQLTPVPSPSTVTVADLFNHADSATRAQKPENAEMLAYVSTDSAVGSLALYEYDDIFVLQVYLYNGSSLPFRMDPSQLVLMDANRTAFRQLATHEAANLFAGRIRGVPPYQPKYSYQFQSTTQGSLRTYGNTGYYNSTTQGNVQAVEDPYHALGYNLGAAIAADRNKKYQAMANTLYEIGLGQSSSVAPKTGGVGAIYWMKRPNWSAPVMLRFGQSGYEVQFTPVAVRPR